MRHDLYIWLGIRNWKVETIEKQVWREEEEEFENGDASLT